MVVCDVGANIGAHTVVFAKIAALVHAFEPQRSVYHTLCGNVALNGLLNVHCHHQAVGETWKTLEIDVLNPDVENNMGAFSLSSKEPQDEVWMAPLQEACNFIKIDVEGHELEVLKGAEAVIRECHPVMYVENDRPEKTQELVSYIRELGYIPYHHETEMYEKSNFNKGKNPWGANLVSRDLLCVRTKLAGFQEASGI
jgi:FkbM family methyltransferase